MLGLVLMYLNADLWGALATGPVLGALCGSRDADVDLSAAGKGKRGKNAHIIVPGNI